MIIVRRLHVSTRQRIVVYTFLYTFLFATRLFGRTGMDRVPRYLRGDIRLPRATGIENSPATE